MQEESTYLGIPCLTLRENTERPITVTQGTNRLVPPDRLAENVDLVLAGRWPRGTRPQGWDGKAATRCVEALRRREEELARLTTFLGRSVVPAGALVVEGEAGNGKSRLVAESLAASGLPALTVQFSQIRLPGQRALTGVKVAFRESQPKN